MGKRFVLSGYYGFKNFGDEAILSVLVNKLKENKHNITVISSNPEYTKNVYKHIRSVYTFDIESIIGSIAKSDALISGGGSLLQDVTSIKSLLYYLFVIFLAIGMGKPVIIFAQGIGPINNFFATILTMQILKKCTYISVRDKKSFALLKKWGIKADLVCDPIFSTQVPQEKNDTVAIQLRACKNMNNDFLDRLAHEIYKNFSNKNIEIYSFQDEIDLLICQNFEKKLKMLNPDINVKIYSNLGNNKIIEHISRAKYLVAMRFHAIIIGLLAKSKILAINYDIKVEKIAQEFKLPMLSLTKEFTNEFANLKAQDAEEIHKLVKNKDFDWSGFDDTVSNI